MDCIISAGGVPQSDDMLYEQTQGRPKALLDLAGKPMVQWVVDALAASPNIDRIVLVGLSEADGIRSEKLVDYIPDQGSLLANAIAGVDWVMARRPETQYIILASSDIPLITPAIVDDYISQCAPPPASIYYATVPRELMESRFPASRRSYVHFTDGDLAGADLFMIDPRIAYDNRELWNDLIGSRKSALKQARRLGLGLLLKLLLRRLSVGEAERRISKAMNLKGRVIKVRYAELGMDVDKPFQYEICRQELLGQ